MLCFVPLITCVIATINSHFFTGLSFSLFSVIKGKKKPQLVIFQTNSKALHTEVLKIQLLLSLQL